MNTELKVSQSNLYQTDYQLWIQDTVEKLKHQDYSQVDWENLLDEIEDMGKSERRSLASNLTIVLLHLLKWQYQCDRRSESWRLSIVEHQIRIEEALEDSPSLKRYLEEILEKQYRKAIRLASAETGLPSETFPSKCPYVIDKVLKADLSEFS
ncbi:DUF29 domain-containing protein [Leptolyngbya sp. NIES-2104]|uniref:DUF29 domain-containing protein n=1 Tax=Leptolyngbya sp. NIES-2104 TaxID=1552121 RepID=UPI0006EC573F|nr:DUF29 domain-containing protein [Leptolyngbya sp. NIES-2104]GAP98372.1 protein of unknown function DUF29 [Leptolyngbya sp. NIES-2104]